MCFVVAVAVLAMGLQPARAGSERSGNPSLQATVQTMNQAGGSLRLQVATALGAMIGALLVLYGELSAAENEARRLSLGLWAPR